MGGISIVPHFILSGCLFVEQPLNNNNKMRGKMENVNFKFGDEILISATYVMQHEIKDIHVVNVKMAKGIPTQGIDLFVSSDVIVTCEKVEM